MALKHIIMVTVLLLLSLLLLPSPTFCNAAMYEYNELSLDDDKNMRVLKLRTFGFLPKGTPVPPSGPSKRHNKHTQAQTPVVSPNQPDQV